MNQAQVDSQYDDDPSAEIQALDNEMLWDETTAPGTDTSAETGTSAETNGRPGIDVVLRDVEQNLGPEYADVVRSIQTNYQKAQANWKSGQRELADRLAELEGALEEVQNAPEESEEDPNDPLNQLTDDQWQMFYRMAEKAGLVSQDQLTEAETSSSQMGYIQNQIADALEEFGEQFGYRDENGEFQFNPERFEEIEDIYSRVFDPDYGMTAKDLYMLADYPRLAAQIEQMQEESGRNRIFQRQRGNVENGTSQARLRSPVYRKGRDSLEDVIARASALSLRE
uniref:Uncharacterized protein n=1 Tax=viral metagenome TaxID=1070528 RepID=A0A6M3L0N6_9ZZZZ